MVVVVFVTMATGRLIKVARQPFFVFIRREAVLGEQTLERRSDKNVS